MKPGLDPISICNVMRRLDARSVIVAKCMIARRSPPYVVTPDPEIPKTGQGGS